MNSAIKGIMDNFNFEKVYKVMSYLKWCWKGREVTRSMIIAHALTDLLAVEANPSPTAYIASGGFVASREGTHYSLNFQLEEWEEDLDELEQLMEQDNERD